MLLIQQMRSANNLKGIQNAINAHEPRFAHSLFKIIPAARGNGNNGAEANENPPLSVIAIFQQRWIRLAIVESFPFCARQS